MRKWSEHVQDRLFGDSWPAAVARRLWKPSFRVWQERIDLPKSLGSAGRLRIAFGSDFHAGPLTPLDAIESACLVMQESSPDLILLGGDFVSLSARHARRLVEVFRTLRAPGGIFAVLGNHDHWAGDSVISSILLDGGIGVLTNRSVRLGDWTIFCAGIRMQLFLNGMRPVQRCSWSTSHPEFWMPAIDPSMSRLRGIPMAGRSCSPTDTRQSCRRVRCPGDTSGAGILWREGGISS
jgi:hypothetical protein